MKDFAYGLTFHLHKQLYQLQNISSQDVPHVGEQMSLHSLKFHSNQFQMEYFEFQIVLQ